MNARQQLRAQCRSARRALPVPERRAASEAICRRLRASPFYWSARRIAFFWPMGPEVDLLALLHSALRHGKLCYLPVMRRDGGLCFVRFREGDPIVPNAQRIPEPRFRPQDELPATQLDLVCMPLAGFDRSGTRLGMGGGYYDRAFSFRLHPHNRKPRLVGVAFACQELPSIPREAWDVPLEALVTEREILSF